MGKRLASSILALLLLLPVAGAPRAHAQSTAAATASEHYSRGTKLFDLRRYKEAAHEYEAAYEARELPELLFDIAQAYRFAAMYEEAIASYRAFLRREPQGPNRTEVEARIHEMQELLAQARKTKESPPQGTQQPNGPSLAASGASRRDEHAVKRSAEPADGDAHTAPPPAIVESSTAAPAPPRVAPRKLMVAGLVTAALGVAAVGVGAAFAVLAKNVSSQVSNGTVFNPVLDHQGKVDQGVAIGLLAGGGALVVGGAVAAIIGWRSGKSARFAVVPTIGINHAGAVAAVRF